MDADNHMTALHLPPSTQLSGDEIQKHSWAVRQLTGGRLNDASATMLHKGPGTSSASDLFM